MARTYYSYATLNHDVASAMQPGRRCNLTTLWRAATGVAFAVVLLVSSPGSVSGSVPYTNYTYSIHGKSTPAPQAYVPSKVLDGESLGVGGLADPQDLFVSNDGSIYLLDSGNRRLICFDTNWSVSKVISHFTKGGAIDTFNDPSGVFVTDEGSIYIADKGNNRVVVLDRSGAFVREIGSPKSDVEGIFSDGFQFLPDKLVVDRAHRLYVKADRVLDGLLQFDAGGVFRSFIGAPRVTANLLDILWKRVATREQLEQMALLVPTEFSNIDLDDRGFIYACVLPGASDHTRPLRRLSPSGVDVLIRSGFFPPMGDVEYPSIWSQATTKGESVFVDIVARRNGLYSALDRKRGRVFTYDSSGNLLYVFGGIGHQVGLVRNPAAIEAIGDELVVLDRAKNCLIVYTPTEYAESIHRAMRLYNLGFYDESLAAWEEVLRYNSNYDLAYSYIGDALLRKGDYEGALRYYRNGDDRLGYSKAFALYRKEVVERHFGTLMTILCAAAITVFVVTRMHLGSRLALSVKKSGRAGHAGTERGSTDTHPAEERSMPSRLSIPSQLRIGIVRNTLADLKYALHVLFHPFDGFYELKHAGKGSLPAALVLIAAAILAFVLNRQYTGFLFNYVRLSSFNIYKEMATVLFPVVLWCLVSWALTTLMDGKGTPRDIVVSAAYSLTPLPIVYVPATLFSNFLILEERPFYAMLLVLAVGWTMALLVIGTAITHDYSIAKTAATIVGVALGILFVLFIGLLFFSVLDVVGAFVRDVWTEATLRL